jgi:hypothetical protein
MRREILGTIALGVFSLVVALTIVPGVMWQAQAQNAKRGIRIWHCSINI